MIHHRDGRRARLGIRGRERASGQWLHAEEREHVRRDERDGEAIGAFVARVVHAHDFGAEHVLEDVALFLEVEKFRRGQRAAMDAIGLRVADDHVDHAIGIAVGERIEQDLPHDAVDDGDRADAERERQHRDQVEAGLTRGPRAAPDERPASSRHLLVSPKDNGIAILPTNKNGCR